MSHNDADQPPRPPRPRSNTFWRRQRPEAPPAPRPISVPDLIQALNPAVVPSLDHARTLANALSTVTNLPLLSTLQPILTHLCHSERPPSIQAAGYDIMAAYFESNEAPSLSTADRQTCFAIFLTNNSPSWSSELWEPRFKALRVFTKFGADTLGIELPLVNLLKSWIRSAFHVLLADERTETERCVDVVATFLTDLLAQEGMVKRLPEEQFFGVMHFFAALVDNAVDAARDSEDNPEEIEVLPSLPSSPARTTHRRNHSSLSVSTLASLGNPPPMKVPKKHPVDTAVSLYLNYLAKHLPSIPGERYEDVLPILFRALAFYATPLPRLSVTSPPPKRQTMEDRLTQVLKSLFAGSFSTTCMKILKKRLRPRVNDDSSISSSIHTSIGAYRTLRVTIRSSLHTRLARAYIQRESSIGYAYTGAPGHMDIEGDVMARAWSKDEVISAGWNAGKLKKALCNSVEEWVGYSLGVDTPEKRADKERILDEAAGILKDVFQELDSREETNAALDEDEAAVVGSTLYQLACYILPQKNSDGTPFIIPLDHPNSAPTTFLRSLSSLLSRDHSTFLVPLLSSTLLFIADHLTDGHTAKLPLAMSDQNELLPISPDWLENWTNLFENPSIIGSARPQTRQTVATTLKAVYDSVRDMPSYRRPLADVVFGFCKKQAEKAVDEMDDTEATWKLLADEVVLRAQEKKDDTDGQQYLDLLSKVVTDVEVDDTDTVSVTTTTTEAPMHSTLSASTPISVLSRMQSDFSGSAPKEKDSGMPSVISLLSSLAASGQSKPPVTSPPAEPDADTPPVPEYLPRGSSPRAVCACIALISIFSQIAFTPLSLSDHNVALALEVFNVLLSVIQSCPSSRARLVCLQFLMRLRADRDHRIYFLDRGFDVDGHVRALSSLINRCVDGASGVSLERSESRRRMKASQERDGRRSSRGRGSGPSRSRSRVATISMPPPPLALKPRDPLWQFPETLPFIIPESDKPSEGLVTYDPVGPEGRIVATISDYLDALIVSIEKETNWEILSYILCFLPAQLSNKHFFCGPLSRKSIETLTKKLCSGLVRGDLAGHIDRWPSGLKSRDAHGLAYHTLSVLISFKRCFDPTMRNTLVEVFQEGLHGSRATGKACLHALSLLAFEFPSSMTKNMSRILESLSTIMSTADVATHVLGFLSIIGSLRPLHANFTEADYKMVFGVALQYLQYHNQTEENSALAQYVRIICYYVIYVWFLALRLPDRPRHVQYIIRQLLVVNEGRVQVDEPTEVCFDWLARYTYASADPRPAHSLLSEIVMNPKACPSEEAVAEKTWLVGNSVVTVRTLARLGWAEVISRRPSGMTKVLCHIENVPLVGPGDVLPDFVSGIAGLIMDRVPTTIPPPDAVDYTPPSHDGEQLLVDKEQRTQLPAPDPITGYVWSRTAPSQRRKDVSLDPSFLMLQFSAYPTQRDSPIPIPPDSMGAFIRNLDRMPVIDTHKVGIMYVAPGQTHESAILANRHGSPAYTRFLEGIGRLINLRGQVDVYAGGLNPDEDGEYAYAWWDDIGQILYHTATMMPRHEHDPGSTFKKRHLGNDYVRIIWNDSGGSYAFDTLKTHFQFINIVIEPHSLGPVAAFSNNLHENEYFKVTVQRLPGMREFAPVGDFKLISAENLPLLVRQLSLMADWYAMVYVATSNDTQAVDVPTNWRSRLQTIHRFRDKLLQTNRETNGDARRADVISAQELTRDFTIAF